MAKHLILLGENLTVVDSKEALDKVYKQDKSYMVEAICKLCNQLNLLKSEPHFLVTYALNMEYISIDVADTIISILNDKLGKRIIDICYKDILKTHKEAK